MRPTQPSVLPVLTMLLLFVLVPIPRAIAYEKGNLDITVSFFEVEPARVPDCSVFKEYWGRPVNNILIDTLHSRYGTTYMGTDSVQLGKKRMYVSTGRVPDAFRISELHTIDRVGIALRDGKRVCPVLGRMFEYTRRGADPTEIPFDPSRLRHTGRSFISPVLVILSPTSVDLDYLVACCNRSRGTWKPVLNSVGCGLGFERIDYRVDWPTIAPTAEENCSVPAPVPTSKQSESEKPLNGCCLDGICRDMPAESCATKSGSVIDGLCPPPEIAVCAARSPPAPEPPPVLPAKGACCSSEGGCRMAEAADCTDPAERYFGDGTRCEDTPCSEFGGCCGDTGPCLAATKKECTEAGPGLVFLPEGCGSGCPVRGSCRMSCPQSAASSCAVTTPEDCGRLGGEFEAGWRCEPVACPASPCKPLLGTWFDECGLVNLSSDGRITASGATFREGLWQCLAPPDPSLAPAFAITWRNGDRERREVVTDGSVALLDAVAAGKLTWTREPVTRHLDPSARTVYPGGRAEVVLDVTNCGATGAKEVPLVFESEREGTSSNPPAWLEITRAQDAESVQSRASARLTLSLKVDKQAEDNSAVRIRAGNDTTGLVGESFDLKVKRKQLEVILDTDPEGD